MVKMITDMSVGKPWKVLLNFSLPLLFSAIFQQLYNIVDTIIAGRCLGENALAAVGASYPITVIFTAIALGATQGASVLISQYFGGKRLTEMKTAVSTCYVSIGTLSIILTVFGVIFCELMLRAMNTPEEIMADSADYLSIYTWGLIFLFIYNIATCVFSSLGDSKIPLILLICSSVGNVGLDLLFVQVLGMGVGSLALATLIAQAIASLLASFVLFRRLRKIETPEKPKLFSRSILGKISRLAIPGILQQSFVSVGNLFIQSVINSYDDPAVIAGYAAAIKLNTFALTMFTTLASGIANFTAQNIGAGREDRVKSGFKSGLAMAEIVAAAVLSVLIIFCDRFIGLFVDDPSETVITTGSSFLLIVAPFYVTICAKLVSDGVLRGSGAMKCFMISTFTDLVLRVALAYVFSAFFGINGVWWSWPVGYVVSMLVALFFYFKGYWKRCLN